MLNSFSKSQLFIAFCALFMSAESYFLANIQPDFIVLATVFFATLFIYNASRLKIAINENVAEKKQSLTLTGNQSHIVWCLVAFVMVFTGLAAIHFFNILIFVFTAVLSVFYMMPFSKNGHPLKGLRNHLVLKNIVLSLVWASATVLFPIAGEENLPDHSGLALMFARRFFFIYALTVVYDIRDIERDKLEGVQTLAVKYGDRGARFIALAILSLFVVFTVADRGLSENGNGAAAIALYFSAFITALVIAGTRKNRGSYYFSYIIDGSMLLQFVLVVLFTAYLP